MLARCSGCLEKSMNCFLFPQALQIISTTTGATHIRMVHMSHRHKQRRRLEGFLWSGTGYVPLAVHGFELKGLAVLGAGSLLVGSKKVGIRWSAKHGYCQCHCKPAFLRLNLKSWRMEGYLLSIWSSSGSWVVKKLHGEWDHVVLVW